MGMIVIQTGGSFKFNQKQFSAMKNGHADAVAQAIEYLAKELLPAATAQDHKLHSEGAQPEDGFERKSA